MDKIEIRKKIDKHENRIWKQGMQNKETLINYRMAKQNIKEERLWKNSEEDKIIRKFQSGILPKNKHKDDCTECKVKNSVTHILNDCKIYSQIRIKYNLQNTNILEILQLKGRNKTDDYLKEIYLSML